MQGFEFGAFDNQDYVKASESTILADAISNVLYPNDNKEKGLRLRLKKQYFFISDSINDIIKSYKATYGDEFFNIAQ